MNRQTRTVVPRQGWPRRVTSRPGPSAYCLLLLLHHQHHLPYKTEKKKEGPPHPPPPCPPPLPPSQKTPSDGSFLADTHSSRPTRGAGAAAPLLLLLLLQLLLWPLQCVPCLWRARRRLVVVFRLVFVLLLVACCRCHPHLRKTRHGLLVRGEGGGFWACGQGRRMGGRESEGAEVMD